MRYTGGKVLDMTYLQRIATVTEVQHRFASDLFGQGVDMCSGCGQYRDDRSHVRTAPAYADSIAANAR